MSMKKKPNKAQAKGWAILLGLSGLFAIRKLTGCASWSWVWVTFPLWMPFAVAIVTYLVILLVTLLQKH